MLLTGLLRFALPLVGLLLAGCQSRLKPSIVGDTMPLLAVHDFGASMQIQQRVMGEYSGSHHEMLCVLELHSDRVSLVGLSNQGLKLFSLQYDGHNLVRKKSRLVPNQLRPQQILADIQLALWPKEEIQRQLDQPWQLQYRPRLRELFYQGNLAAVVRYEADDPLQGQFTLTNYRYGYSLVVQTLVVVAL